MWSADGLRINSVPRGGLLAAELTPIVSVGGVPHQENFPIQLNSSGLAHDDVDYCLIMPAGLPDPESSPGVDYLHKWSSDGGVFEGGGVGFSDMKDCVLLDSMSSHVMSATRSVSLSVQDVNTGCGVNPLDSAIASSAVDAGSGCNVGIVYFRPWECPPLRMPLTSPTPWTDFSYRFVASLLPPGVVPNAEDNPLAHEFNLSLRVRATEGKFRWERGPADRRWQPPGRFPFLR